MIQNDLNCRKLLCPLLQSDDFIRLFLEGSLESVLAHTAIHSLIRTSKIAFWNRPIEKHSGRPQNDVK
jgi:hypothetical protein